MESINADDNSLYEGRRRSAVGLGQSQYILGCVNVRMEHPLLLSLTTVMLIGKWLFILDLITGPIMMQVATDNMV